MIPFELLEPKSLQEAASLLDPNDISIRPMGGGTALMLMMKAGVFVPRCLVSLQRTEDEWRQISCSSEGLTIGALVTLGQLERSSLISERAPLIRKTLTALSNVRVRNVATVGGALAHGDPHMDLPPVLMALSAVATVISPTGIRRTPIEDLLVGYYETSLTKNELISEIFVPHQAGRFGHYFKVTTGSAHDWPALGVTILAEPDGQSLKSVRLVASAATDKATRLTSAEETLSCQKVSVSLLEEATDAALKQLEFVSDTRGSVPYKRELMRVYLRRAIHRVFEDGVGLL
jgi:carbon-monoxide dehydrogenase medium subunit